MSATTILPVIHMTNTSVTFKATSNAVTATPTSGGTDLEDAIKGHKSFRAAFKNETEESKERERYFSSRPDTKDTVSIIQSSRSSGPVHLSPGGLVSTVVTAYSQHHCLTLRPDDVWQAILTQFSFYVCANAEDLRDCFVDFKGKKTLVITMEGNLFSADYATFANRMVDEKITPNIKDPEVTEWLLPSFSTTTADDRVAASVTIMSTLQSYFEYVSELMCGLPEVTLEGTVEDWKLLRQKIDRLPRYDLQGLGFMAEWHALLAPVLDEFVASAEGLPKLEFWDTVCSFSGGGSGPSYLSGWMTVFACFTDEGEWRGDVPDVPPGQFGFEKRSPKDNTEYNLKYPFLNRNSIPSGAVSVPVLVDDNGIQFDTQMLAGQFAFETAGPDNTTMIRSRTDWCIAYEGEPKAHPRDYKDGEICQTMSPVQGTKRP